LLKRVKFAKLQLFGQNIIIFFLKSKFKLQGAQIDIEIYQDAQFGASVPSDRHTHMQTGPCVI
jgi:hypothetical protein